MSRLLAEQTAYGIDIGQPAFDCSSKMTGLPAQRLRLSDRGELETGKKADMVIFNPEIVSDTATFADPYRYPVGIEYVYVNGQAVVTPDGHTGALPGQVLKP